MEESIMSTDLFTNFKWTNQSEVIIKNNTLKIKAHARSDFFNDPAKGAMSNKNAAFFFTEINYDFILKAKVTHSFQSVYDACALMVMNNDNCWAKLCFELTDFGTHAVVSVVTNGISDDANGVNIDGNTVYLQIVKKGDIFAFHYSLDGNKYTMARYFGLPLNEIFKVGFVAQSPLGDGGDFLFEDISFKNESVTNLREGI